MQYLDQALLPPSMARPGHWDPGESFKMSESTRDYVSLRAFLEVPRGGTMDPAKRVCGVYPPWLVHYLIPL